MNQKKSMSTHKLNASTKQLLYGQPTAQSHPHLLKTGEIIPNITKNELQERRYKLVDLIKQRAAKCNEQVKTHIVVIPSATKKYMSDKIPYVFRQNTDYLYLSGCMEPDSCLVLTANDSSSEHCSVLFVRNPDSHSELWDGPRTSSETAPSFFGVDESLPMCELQGYLYNFIKSHMNCAVWYDFTEPIQPFVNDIISDFIQEKINKVWENPTKLVHKLRLIKSPAEIELMKTSCNIGSEAFVNTISSSRPDISEHQIFAQVDYECRMRGAEYLAYPPVIAGGDRATIIHYINNNQKVLNGEMVLMDAGCEYHGYSSDITRTWPINGKFTQEQKILYQIVQCVQYELINLLFTFPSLDNLFDSMCILLGKQLQEAGFISKNASSEQIFRSAYEFCPHHVSHYLGMDVHDTGLIKRNIRIEPGMIVTVEPGLYISHRHDVPDEFKGLGIRIEDDVLITENGPIVLTENCPKDLSEIEAIASREL